MQFSTNGLSIIELQKEFPGIAKKIPHFCKEGHCKRFLIYLRRQLYWHIGILQICTNGIFVLLKLTVLLLAANQNGAREGT